MRLTKDGQVISLDNENHISAFLASGWTETKVSAPFPTTKAEVQEEQKTEAKKPVDKKKQEKR